MNNKMKLEFLSQSQNEVFARNVISSFALLLNPTISELSDIKTAVSEAVTNSIVHAYDGQNETIIMEAEIIDKKIHIKITDYGKGIKNVSEALEPFFTTCPTDERSGMGFTIMQTYMDDFEVISKPKFGTVVSFSKTIK